MASNRFGHEGDRLIPCEERNAAMAGQKMKKTLVRIVILAVVSVVLLGAMLLLAVLDDRNNPPYETPEQAGQAEMAPAGGDVVLEDAVPLAVLPGHWALTNLVVAIVAVGMGLVLAVELILRSRRTRRGHGGAVRAGGLWAALSLAVGVVPLAVVAATQNFAAAMHLVDGWSLSLVATLVLQVMFLLLMRRARYIEMERLAIAAQARA